MRVVYDDAKASEAVKAVRAFISRLRPMEITSYEYGMKRVRAGKLHRKLNAFLQRDYGMYIGNHATHAYGIGNNCRYPIHYKAGDEIQICAYININSGMFGELFVYLDSYEKERYGEGYTITTHGVRNGIAI